MSEHTSTSRSRRIGYPTWNLVTVIGFVALALADTVPVVVEHLQHPLPWFVLVISTAALVWGIRSRRRLPSSLLPRLYLLVAVPAWLLLILEDDLTSFWLNAIWLLIVPAVLSDAWIDRLFGAPGAESEDARNDPAESRPTTQSPLWA